MKPGKASQTAVIVCAGRAIAHGRSSVARYADPTALALLPDDARARVQAHRAGVATGVRARVMHRFAEQRSKMMVARTVAIDDAVREAQAPQVVILGAGLDGRAWRMAELADVVVFEVDHPDSQRDKRARIGSLRQAARDVRFVAVDFARDRLDEALAAAGHDSALRTTWIWEGVVMYLGRAAVEATARVVEARSAAGGRLVVAYHSPAPILALVGLVVRWLGEPLRSRFTPEAMRDLLAAHGLRVVRDDDIHTVGAALAPDLGVATQHTKHLRIVTAERTARP